MTEVADGMRQVVGTSAVSTTVVIFACCTLFVGAMVQSVVGFGMNLIAVPVLLLAHANEFVPGPLIVVLFAMSVVLGTGEFRMVDWHLLSWFLPARVVGTFIGSVVATKVSKDVAVILISGMIIGAVALSMRGMRLPPTPSSWMGTGVASGFSNVLSSIGGPPLALVMVDHQPGSQRATQGWSGMIGSLLSVGMLRAQGEFGMDDLRWGAVLIAPAVAGSLLVVPLRKRLPDAHRMRPYVYATAAGGALAVLLRTLLT